MNRITRLLPQAAVVATALFVTTRCSLAYSVDVVCEVIAGTGDLQDNGGEGAALSVNIGHPFGVEIGPDGNLYIAEVANHRICKLDLRTNVVTTVAGCGRQGYAGDGGAALAAELNEPYEIRFDAAGNLFFVDMRSHVVRRIDDATGIITTVAGTGQPGFDGDGGPATKAQLREPHSITLDRHGHLYIADIGNHRIRRVDGDSGIIETIAGNGKKMLPVDGQTARGQSILGPRALAIDGDLLWIALREGHSVWRLHLVDGKLRHVAGSGKRGYAGDGGPPKAAELNGPKGIAVGPNGDVYVADTENNAVRCIDLKRNLIHTVIGKPVTAADQAAEQLEIVQSPLKGPHGICVGADGTVYVGDTLNHVVRRSRPDEMARVHDPAAQIAAAEAKIHTGDLDAALAIVEPLLATEAASPPGQTRAAELGADLLHYRGEKQFRRARIAEAIADFDREIRLQPERAPSHWQRGIALYYAQQYEAGAKQFELHQTVNPQDVENAAWHFLCAVRSPAGSIESARKQLIDVTRDPRIPMAQVQQMFAGAVPPEEVLKFADAADDAARFYADLYVGLHYEALGRAADSLRHITRAAESPAAKGNYMGDVARVHVILRTSPDNEP